MSLVLAKITAVQQNIEIVKRDGGTYTGTRLCYVAGGEERKKEIHATILKNNPALAAKIQALEGQIGKEVTLDFQKKNGFQNLMDILPASAAGSSGGNSGGGFSGNNSKFSGGGFKRGNNPTDTARIARATAVAAAAEFSDNVVSTLKAAEQLAAFILEPVGVDTLGEKLKTDAEVAETVEEKSDDNQLPF